MADPTTTGPTVTEQDVTDPNAVADSQNPILGALRAALAPAPGMQYGDVLPVAWPSSAAGSPASANPSADSDDSLPHPAFTAGGVEPPTGGPTASRQAAATPVEQGNYHLALPNSLRGLGNGVLDLLEVPKTGQMTPAATGALASLVIPDIAAAPEPGVLRTFGGLNSASVNPAMLKNLDRAQAQDSVGVSPNLTWRDTGWSKGPDDLWRYEIDDSKAKLTPQYFEDIGRFQNQPFRTTLGSALDHEDLFRAYPDLKNMEVVVAPNGAYAPQGILGSYMRPDQNGNGEHMFVAGDRSPDQVVSTLLHESQHALQQREGFEKGASSNSANNARQGLDALYDQGLVPPDLRTAESASRTLTPFDLYNRVAGEVEARNVQQRRQLTAAERSYTPPGVSADTAPKFQLPINKISALVQQYQQFLGQNHGD